MYPHTYTYVYVSVLRKSSFLSLQNTPDPTFGAGVCVGAGFGDGETTISEKVYWPAENSVARMLAKWHEKRREVVAKLK